MRESQYGQGALSQSLKKQHKSHKVFIVLAIIIVLGLIAGIVTMFVLAQRDPDFLSLNRPNFTEPIYSNLTGLEITDANLNQSPTFCVQIPNGSTDGARPQAGLNDAAVIFEAVAEQGITRFAAIFQNPTVSVIGPVRSLRSYYLEWDTPFDCTIVHSGGSNEALATVSNGQYRNLDIDTGYYSWRENNSIRLWNNLFTSPSELLSYNQSKGYTTSNPKVFPRLSPEQLETLRAENDTCANDSACLLTTANSIQMTFWNIADYSTTFRYDPETNTYPRFYATGEAHISYECPANLTQPNTTTDCGDPVQIAPSTVVAMIIQENTASDQYHETIATSGKGTAYIFQNGTVAEATWHKTSASSQITFTDSSGNEVPFAPGQLWIAAIPQYGNVSWE